MTPYDDLETAVRFLKSINTGDAKTDIEIDLIVQRLEALLSNTRAGDEPAAPAQRGDDAADGNAGQADRPDGIGHGGGRFFRRS
jgi:hypothetical protein